MDNCKCWVGACGVGLPYPFFDGGGHSLMVVDVGAHGVRLPYPFVNGGRHSLMVVNRKPWVTPHLHCR